MMQLGLVQPPIAYDSNVIQVLVQAQVQLVLLINNDCLRLPKKPGIMRKSGTQKSFSMYSYAGVSVLGRVGSRARRGPWLA